MRKKCGRIQFIGLSLDDCHSASLQVCKKRRWCCPRQRTGVGGWFGRLVTRHRAVQLHLGLIRKIGEEELIELFLTGIPISIFAVLEMLSGFFILVYLHIKILFIRKNKVWSIVGFNQFYYIWLGGWMIHVGIIKKMICPFLGGCWDTRKIRFLFFEMMSHEKKISLTKRIHFLSWRTSILHK